MPLEVHDYLVSQGWGGKGTALRQGAISRPLAIPQKKTLAGLGKDRDEAFPFWDHLFSAAAKSIQLKCLSDDEKEEGDETLKSDETSLRKTQTGIFSTRRPVDGEPADSGTTTPNEVDTDSSTPRLSLMALAKRDAAKRRLYAQFFRGPVLGPETIAEEERRLAALVQEAFDKQNSGVESITITEHIEVKTADKNMIIDLEVSKSTKKKRKAKDPTDEVLEGDEGEEARKERKRRRKEEKRRKEGNEAAKLQRRNEKKERKKAKEAATESICRDITPSSKHVEEGNDRNSKSERRRKKEEKKKLKSLQHQKNIVTDEKVLAETHQTTPLRKEQSTSHSKSNCNAVNDGEPIPQDRKRKKKRKREDDPDNLN